MPSTRSGRSSSSSSPATSTWASPGTRRPRPRAASPSPSRTRRRALPGSTTTSGVGPSRNFAAPDAKVTRTYAFPHAWTKSGTVRLGGHPDDHLLGLFGERAGVHRRRPEHGRRLRHGLRRPRQRPLVRRREAGHPRIAGVLSRHERRRRDRRLRRPPLLHLERDRCRAAPSCPAARPRSAWSSRTRRARSSRGPATSIPRSAATAR